MKFVADPPNPICEDLCQSVANQHCRYDPKKLRFVIQLSRDNGKTWESTCQSLDDGKLAMICVDCYAKTSREFKWRYLDTSTGVPAGVMLMLMLMLMIQSVLICG